ncbi:hypothetical protein PMAYCL1PPCAC_14948, partial [Pristionchus mayeri]
GLLYISMLMTLNRMAVFVYPSWRRIFDRYFTGNILIPILICWDWVVIMCLLCLLVTPTQRFNRDTLRFENDGDPIVNAPILMHINQALDNMIPFIIAIMYVRIYFSIRSSRSVLLDESVSDIRLAEDRKIFKQALIICVFLVFYNLIELALIFITMEGWV